MEGVQSVIHTATLHKPHLATHSAQDFIDTNPASGVRPEHFPILATDVSNRSLNIARAGRYPERDYSGWVERVGAWADVHDRTTSARMRAAIEGEAAARSTRGRVPRASG